MNAAETDETEKSTAKGRQFLTQKSVVFLPVAQEMAVAVTIEFDMK